jgi:hypothetical protein
VSAAITVIDIPLNFQVIFSSLSTSTHDLNFKCLSFTDISSMKMYVDKIEAVQDIFELYAGVREDSHLVAVRLRILQKIKTGRIHPHKKYLGRLADLNCWKEDEQLRINWKMEEQIIDSTLGGGIH